MTIVTPKPEHQVAYEDLCALVNKHADKVSAEELLAIAANMVGKLIAFQDQCTMSQERAMKTVTENMARGNEEAFEAISKSEGSA